MRRIDKSKILSTEYKKWVDELDRSGEKHPDKYDRYYTDVVMNLLYCQGGVCAYTEIFLCKQELLKESNWVNGIYLRKKKRNKCEIPVYYNNEGEEIDFNVNLDHFDPEKKKDNSWDWDNLFVTESKINNQKRDVAVYDILKPDSPNYDPFRLLVYDIDSHQFSPHGDLSDEESERVKWMIAALGLNRGRIRDEREEFLNRIREYESYNKPFTIDRFFTACEMVRSGKNIISNEEIKSWLEI
jgi:hypothetical protein